MKPEKLAYFCIKEATKLYQQAYEAVECPICREDIKLVLEASRELEDIAKWAAHTHEKELQALRKLGAELERLKLLNALIKVYKLVSLFRWRR